MVAAFFMPAYRPGASPTHQTNGWCVQLVDPQAAPGSVCAALIGWF